MSLFSGFLGKKAQASPSSTISLEKQITDILVKLTSSDSNQNIPLIQEIAKTIDEDSKTASTDLQMTIKKTKVGLEELLKGVSNPDAELIDQLFSLIVVSKSKETTQSKQQESDEKTVTLEKAEKQPVTQTQSSQENTVKTQPSATQNESNPPTNDIQENSAKKSSESSSDEDISNSNSGQAMLGLMMDEIKELVLVTSKTNKRVEDLEAKSGTIVEGIQDEQKTLSQDVAEMKTKIEKMEKSIEKFIGLYEVISNMYNPFATEESKHLGEKKPASEENANPEEKPEEPSSTKNFFDAQIDKQKELSKNLKKE